MNSPAIRIRRTRASGLEMHALFMGESPDAAIPTYVLVHGLGMSGRYMMPTAELLAAHGRVVVPDLPGFGGSEKPSRALTIPELADGLAAWMAAHDLPPSVLIGNSLGAQVIADLAVRHPHFVERAVLVAPTVDPGARRVSTQTLRLLADALREPLRLYPIALGDYFRAGFRRSWRTLRHALVDPIVEKLPSVACPVLIVRGGRDPIVPQGWVEQAAGLIPDVRLVTFPEAAHAVNFNSPGRLVEEILRFQGR
ncbi:alpha/beta hydrolase [Luteolibacter yonseiensis]|uniref:alpha/beta fold hydrolase n=1 Tax=Luteolibacter yonseiensis TaxID=1144680 RepID=UPI002D80C7E4|nr:alpha/beta hydrolase [Luteolibacter yonseiensis]